VRIKSNECKDDTAKGKGVKYIIPEYSKRKLSVNEYFAFVMDFREPYVSTGKGDGKDGGTA
jgi:hypothetical protein